MQHADIYIANPSLVLGTKVTLAEAQAAGQISARRARLTEQRTIRIAKPGAPLAGRAAHRTLLHSNIDAEQIGPVFHAANPPIDSDPFNTTAKVMDLLDINVNSHSAVTIANGDQGVIDALSAAAHYLAACAPSGPMHALVTAGGVWPTGRRRWDESLPVSDGAGALVVTKEPQKTRLVATATRTYPHLAELWRNHRHRIRSRLTGLFNHLLIEVLADADIKRSDLTYLITPFGSNRIEHAVALPDSGIDQAEIDHLVDAGRDIGHLGAADLIAAMKHAGKRPGAPAQNGVYALLLASGTTSVGAAVLEVRWPRDELATR